MKRLCFVLLTIGIVGWFSSCTSKEEKAKIAAWDKIFPGKNPDSLVKQFVAGETALAQKDFQISDTISIRAIVSDHEWAFKCENNFTSLFNTYVDADEKAYSNSIRFEYAALKDWINKIQSQVEAVDNIAIQLGRYPSASESHADPDPKPAGYKPHPKRVTAFLWPYYKGKPARRAAFMPKTEDGLADPYNLGEIHP